MFKVEIPTLQTIKFFEKWAKCVICFIFETLGFKLLAKILF